MLMLLNSGKNQRGSQKENISHHYYQNIFSQLEKNKDLYRPPVFTEPTVANTRMNNFYIRRKPKVNGLIRDDIS